MKKLIFVLSISMIVLASCTGVKTVTKGLENEAFLEFIGNPNNYKDGIEVVVNDNLTFKAEVNKDHSDRPKGNVYAISTGRHTIIVKYRNNVIYQSQIFISAQETKQINLP